MAGTGWLFARPEFDGAFDVLFVDEAGQMSLANVVALGTSARSIVLIGDPNQLPMVTQGVQPGGAVASSLEHLVGDAQTMPPDRGLFLETSRRLHPDVNAFISEAFYGGLLTTHPKTALRTVDGTIRRCPARAFGGCRRRTQATDPARARKQRSSPRPLPP